MKNVYQIQQKKMLLNKKNKHLYVNMIVHIHFKQKDIICMKNLAYQERHYKKWKIFNSYYYHTYSYFNFDNFSYIYIMELFKQFLNIINIYYLNSIINYINFYFKKVKIKLL